MNDEKIIFKCTTTKSMKDIIEASKIVNKKKYMTYKITLVIILIFFFSYTTLHQMTKFQIQFTESIAIYLTNLFCWIINLIIIFCIVYTAEIIWQTQLIYAIIFKKGKNEPIHKYICFYDDKCTLYYELDSKIQFKVNIIYNTITNCYITKNIILLVSNQSKVIINKSLFEIGNSYKFVDFIREKINGDITIKTVNK